MGSATMSFILSTISLRITSLLSFVHNTLILYILNCTVIEGGGKEGEVERERGGGEGGKEEKWGSS